MLLENKKVSRNHKADMSISERLAAKSKLNLLNGCLEWFGSTNLYGYGELTVGYKNYKAHRLSYEDHFGAIPRNMYVCHTCDNPKCINPNHLFIGSQSDNMQDCSKKNRIYAPIGQNSPHAKLNDDIVIQIFNDKRPVKELIKYYNSSASQIFGIKNGTRWAHVTSKLENRSDH